MEHESYSYYDSKPPAEEILQAAYQHDVPRLKQLLCGTSTEPTNVQDPYGHTPLHKAIEGASWEVKKSLPTTEADVFSNSGNAPTEALSKISLEMATQTVRLLLENGAIWNELDTNNDTPGCLAQKLGLDDLYQIMVDAGVRAEMLLSLLDDAAIPDDNESGRDGTVSTEEATISTDEPPTNRPPLPLSRRNLGFNPFNQLSSFATDNQTFLQSSLSFVEADRVVDSRENLAVMMDWETEIMERSVAELIESKQSARVLNIGHGLGIIDEIFQAKRPGSHYIIEAHADVLDRMRRKEWYSMPGVMVIEGRWQDEAHKLIEQGITFDAIYFDTYAEDYRALRTFFESLLPGLLTDQGKFGFFNGLGADRQICYDVYQSILKIDLLEAGFDVKFILMGTSHLTVNTWKDLARPYWKLDEYRLPVVTFS